MIAKAGRMHRIIPFSPHRDCHPRGGFLGTLTSDNMMLTAFRSRDNRGQKMADGNPPRLRGTRCPVAGFSNQPNAQPEMTAKIFRAKPLVRLSYSLNPLGAQFPSAGSMCRLARQPHDPQHRWIYQFRGPWAFPTMYVSRCIAAPVSGDSVVHFGLFL